MKDGFGTHTSNREFQRSKEKKGGGGYASVLPVRPNKSRTCIVTEPVTRSPDKAKGNSRKHRERLNRRCDLKNNQGYNVRKITTGKPATDPTFNTEIHRGASFGITLAFTQHRQPTQKPIEINENEEASA